MAMSTAPKAKADRTKHTKNSSSLQIPMAALNLSIHNQPSLKESNTLSPSASVTPSPNSVLHSPTMYSAEIIRQLSLALRFLLHKDSPFNAHDNTFNSGKRYREFNTSFNTKETNKLNKLLDSLWSNSRSRDHSILQSLYKFWLKWYDYNPESDEDSDEDDFKNYKPSPIQPEASTLHSTFGASEEEGMKSDYLDFIYQHTYYMNKYDLLNENESTNVNIGNEEKKSEESMTNQRPMNSMRDPDDTPKIRDLKKIYSRSAMKKWLRQYKAVHRDNGCMRVCKRFRWKKDVSYNMPMNKWDWQSVVSFVEDNEYLKHFSSIFYEYQIDGQELCCMRFKTFEYLIEIALIQNQNVFETDFDKFKRMRKDINNDWQLGQEIANLLKYIHRGRIQSHVVSRYYLIWEILRHKRHRDKTAKCIYDILYMLQPSPIAGPKQFWKMSAFYYSKIDNFLAVLCADSIVRKIYRRYYPNFLDDNENDSDFSNLVFGSNPNAKLSKKRITETTLRVVQTGPRLWRLRSTDPNTNKSEFLADEDMDLFRNDTITHTPDMNGGMGTVSESVYRTRTNRLGADINPMKKKRRYDCFDLCADKCCQKDSMCNQYTHAIPRVYFKALAMCIFGLFFGCLFVTMWYYNAAIIATDLAMKLTIESIGEREVSFIDYQLFAPQSLQSIGFGEIKIQSDILDAYNYTDTNARNTFVTDGSLDYLLVEWSDYANSRHIASFFLFNNNTNTLIGGYKVNDSMVISVYNGTCRHEWIYDASERKRDLSQPFGAIDCAYSPRSRPWYTEVIEIGGIDNSVWTKPYWFQEGVYGMTLSTMIEHQGTVYTFLNELTVETITTLYENERLLLPADTVMYIVTPSLDVLLSSVGEIDLYNIADCQATCHATDHMIVESVQFLREHSESIRSETASVSDGYVEYSVGKFGTRLWIDIFPFQALYMDSLLFDRVPKPGYVVIVYNEVHWEDIDYAYAISWILSGLMLFIGTVMIIYNIKFHRAAYYKRQRSNSLRESTTHESMLGPDGDSTLHKDPSDRPMVIMYTRADTNGVGVTKQMSEIKEEEDDEHSELELRERTDIVINNIDTNAVKQDSVNSVAEDDDYNDQLLVNTVSLKKETGMSGNEAEEEEQTPDIDNASTTKSSISNLKNHKALPSESPGTYSPAIGSGNSGEDLALSNLSKLASIRRQISLKVKFEPRCCQLAQPVLVIVLFLFMAFNFMVIIGLWNLFATSTMNELIDDVMAPQEWNAVRDKVMHLIESAESMKQIIDNRLNDENLKDIFEEPEFDRIFTNAMHSYMNSNHLYNQYFVFVGKPDGTFRGARLLRQNETDLLITVRDGSNNYSRQTFYTDDDNIARTDEIQGTNEIYDPRCRPWYLDAVTKRFSGTLRQAFPGDTWEEFSNDKDKCSLSRNTQACEDAVEYYRELFNVNGTLNSTQDSMAINQENDTSMYVVWSTYVFTSLNAVGITASATIKEKGSDNLLGVFGMDYTLDEVSKLLNESGGGTEIEYENWLSWIFSANASDPYMVASSHFDTLTTTDSIEGCLQLENEQKKMPYSVYNHPDRYIKVLSTEVLDHYTTEWFIPNDTIPFELEAPIDYPISQGGRVSYGPEGSGLDWMIMKLVDVSHITAIAEDALKTTATVLALILVVSFICFKEITVQFSNGYNEEELERDALDKQTEQEEEEQDYLKDMFKMQTFIEGAANKLWAAECREDGDDLMTTEKAKDFMAERANKHITEENDRNQIFIGCVLQYTHLYNGPNYWHKYMTFMFSNYYALPCQLVIIFHIFVTFWEPSNPTQLKDEGLSNTLIVLNVCCILLEFMFCILLNTIHRYGIFSIKREHLIRIYELYYGISSDWTKKIRADASGGPWNLIFFGPHMGRYIARIVIWCIIAFDFITRTIWKIGFFSYRVPPLPFLLIVENRHVWDFFWEFISAIKYASDVVMSYLAFIVIFAISAMSLLSAKEIDSEELTVDSFDSITRSVITAFVYISTSENYDAVVAEVFKDTALPRAVVVSGLAICLAFVVFGLFLFIPMIIHRFEEAFNKTRIHKTEEDKYKKSEALIAAFIMLDMDGSLDIDRQEFNELVTHSILVNKNKLFDVFNSDDSDDVIDINEFVSNLCKQEFRNKMFYFGEVSQNKLQAFLECNVFRRYRNRLMTFLVLVLPVFGFTSLRGLTDIDNYNVDILLKIFFGLNFIDVILRWFAFGYRRFFDIERFPNPPFTTAAINKYNSSRKMPLIDDWNEDSSKIIRLSASDRKWVVNNLRDTRPESVLEKTVLSICHRLEFICFIFTAGMFFLSLTPFFFSDTTEPKYILGYRRHILELGIFVRFFTLLGSNQKLLYVVFTVFPKFASLITFLILFIYGWAKLGCTLFGDGDREIITPEVYPAAINITTNFSTLSYSMLTLLQLMIGEGWHEIMYYNVLSTSLIFSTYFLLYIFVVTIIIANVFVGLFLADIDELKNKQDNDDTLSQFVKRSRKFKSYAKYKLKELHYELQQIDDKRQLKLKQIQTFKMLLNEQNKNRNRSVDPTLLMAAQTRNTTFSLFD